MRARTVSLTLVALVAIAGLATVVVPRLRGSDSSSPSAYCKALRDNQSRISDIVTSGDPTALVDNLSLFQTLTSTAPSDVAASWTALTTAIASLKSAIAATGHRPADFAGGHTPAGLTAAQRQAIAAAADTLSAPTTVSAAAAIDQEVRDVCQLDLGM